MGLRLLEPSSDRAKDPVSQSDTYKTGPLSLTLATPHQVRARACSVYRFRVPRSVLNLEGSPHSPWDQRPRVTLMSRTFSYLISELAPRERRLHLVGLQLFFFTLERARQILDPTQFKLLRVFGVTYARESHAREEWRKRPPSVLVA